ITVTGANDAPVITGGATGATVFEAGDLDQVTGADEAANFRFEPHQDHDALIGGLFAPGMDMDAILDTVQTALGPDADRADAIAQVWDFIDDNYSYYNNLINEASARLGVEYVLYLQAGGRPLTDVVAKFTPDGGDAGSDPDRLQSLHDNLLGNLHGPSLIDKLLDAGGGGSNPAPSQAAYDAILQLLAVNGLSDILNRPIYSGNETATNDALAWDQAAGLLPLASGQLTASDVDAGETALLQWQGDAPGTYGTFAINPATGEWTYTLDNSLPATQALTEGQTETETFTVTVADPNGAIDTIDVTITVTGANDA
ncbi:VCBS domain-containing protein, partial [Mesorhizobium sp. Z1-4]|uniref:VCBS domain-containing protein n=1 Tax=Mesorhizobium sp. Z1-4 TaxID=2448478 RepID=UPI001981C6EE